MRIILPAVLAALFLGACGSATSERTSPPATPRATTAPSPTRTSSAATTPRRSPTPTPSPTVPAVSAVSAAARRAGLHDIRTVVPDAIVDLRYATRRNFTGVRLYPKDARCLVHSSMRRGLAAAGRAAHRRGLRLVFWDCYRPHDVQVRMFDVVPNPAWVARPGPYARSHEAGRSVDVTLARGGEYLDMGTGFDDFTARATAYATNGVSTHAERNRALLRKIMGARGLTVYDGEWWHFDGPSADTARPHLDAPVR